MDRDAAHALSIEELNRLQELVAWQLPFGDSTYVLRHLRECLMDRLERAASGYVSASNLIAATAGHDEDHLDRLFADTTLRCAIVQAHEETVAVRHDAIPTIDCDAIFAAAARFLESASTFRSPIQDGSLQPIGQRSYHGLVWSADHAYDAFGRAFRSLITRQYRALPITPSETQLEQLRVGAELLDELLPDLGPSAMAHAQIVTIVPSAGSFTGVGSSSQFHLGGVVFLSDHVDNPWWVAEHLLHESLHQKLYDFRHAHSLVHLGYAEGGNRPVTTPWNASRLLGKNRWNELRVYAGFHVYVHLVILSLIAQRRSRELVEQYGPFQGMIHSRRAAARASYLESQLRECCWDKLDGGGRAMLEWLGRVLSVVNPDPNGMGSVLTHALDLYRREAQGLQRSLGSQFEAVEGMSALDALAMEDVAETRAILQDVGASVEMKRLDDRLNCDGTGTHTRAYPFIRSLIADSLERSTIDGYWLSADRSMDARACAMVERSSDQLHALSTRTPSVVLEAMRRVVATDFRQPSDDVVGRLLAVLASNLPVGARVLEIGTGVGLGTAWICSGLGARYDIELVTIESDPDLHAVTANYPWPSFVTLLQGDAERLVDTLGQFDLVFADASPYKLHHHPELVRLLRPEGSILFDDIKPGTGDHPDPDVLALRLALLNDPLLLAVELECASGIVVATRLG